MKKNLILQSYLYKRKFFVKVDDEDSEICTINAGVPQGSVLGPILYTIYTSDLPEIQNVTIATYADDTAIIASDVCPIKASSLVQSELNLMDGEVRLVLQQTDKVFHVGSLTCSANGNIADTDNRNLESLAMQNIGIKHQVSQLYCGTIKQGCYFKKDLFHCTITLYPTKDTTNY